jgi:hypothetical protein
MIESIDKTIAMGMQADKCFCIGGDKNFKSLTRLNDQQKWFKEIIPLPHPRFIMQYRRKKMKEYIEFWIRSLSS